MRSRSCGFSLVWTVHGKRGIENGKREIGWWEWMGKKGRLGENRTFDSCVH